LSHKISENADDLATPHGWHAGRRVVRLTDLGILKLLLPAIGCPSSQIAIELPTAVPLWKVMVGPRAD